MGSVNEFSSRRFGCNGIKAELSRATARTGPARESHTPGRRPLRPQHLLEPL